MKIKAKLLLNIVAAFLIPAGLVYLHPVKNVFFR
jgi:hypothetical protein